MHLRISTLNRCGKQWSTVKADIILDVRVLFSGISRLERASCDVSALLLENVSPAHGPLTYLKRNMSPAHGPLTYLKRNMSPAHGPLTYLPRLIAPYLLIIGKLIAQLCTSESNSTRPKQLTNNPDRRLRGGKKSSRYFDRLKVFREVSASNPFFQVGAKRRGECMPTFRVK